MNIIKIPEELILNINSSIKDAIKSLNKTGKRICFIKSKENFIGTLTDGDIRSGLLSGLTLSSSVKKIINYKPYYIKKIDNNFNEIFNKKKIIDLIPIVNSKNELIGYTKEIIKNYNTKKEPFVIMAGGYGKRLMPYTKNIPKPMIKINKKPILEHIILRAKNQGFINFYILTHYLSSKIEKYFGDGSFWGVKIKYIKEDEPLGTAGGLFFLKKEINGNFVVCNGDIITNINYDDFLSFHEKIRSYATMAVKVLERSSRFGVVNVKGHKIKKISEKPRENYYINSGIYIFNSSLIKKIFFKKSKFSMISLFKKIIKLKLNSNIYPIIENWEDIGILKQYFKYFSKKN
jgi:dTDP-glucose pyrophosphorylase